MSIDKMREEYEARAKRTLGGDHRTNDLGEYVNEDWEYPWWAWQASRAALEVELPEQSPETPFSMHMVMVSSSVIEAIESAGVRVKP